MQGISNVQITIEIITPDKIILKSEATEVTIPSFEGQMGILKDHIPLITFLRPGIIIVQNQEEKKYGRGRLCLLLCARYPYT